MSEEEANRLKEDLTAADIYGAEDLHALVSLLRSAWGCPWDREQTHRSIRKNFIEEVYEAAEAIDRNDPDMLREELGDVLFQVMFHTVLAEEEGAFTWEEVVSEVCRKMIIRHPHVFGEASVHGTEEVLTNWDAIKARTKEQKTPADTVDAVAKTLPALMRAQKTVKRSGILSEAESAKTWLPQTECAAEREADPELRLGEELFKLCAYAQRQGMDAEEELTRYTERFAASLRNQADENG